MNEKQTEDTEDYILVYSNIDFFRIYKYLDKKSNFLLESKEGMSVREFLQRLFD